MDWPGQIPARLACMPGAGKGHQAGVIASLIQD